MSAKIKGIYFTLANEQRQRCRNGIPLCFTVPIKGTGSSQARCPRASEGHVCAQQAEGVALPGGWKCLASREGACAHQSYTLLLVYFILSRFLQGAQDQLPSPTRSVPGCCLPCFLLGLQACIAYSCGSWLDLFRVKGLDFTGIRFCP